MTRWALALILLMAPLAATAQSVSIDLGAAGQAGATGRLVQLTALITGLSLAPSLLMMMTAFTRIIIALSILRSALALQGVPPNTVLIGLALFLTFNVMEPVFDQAWTEAIKPMSEGKLTDIEGLQRAAAPFRGFMLANTRPDDLQLFADLAHVRTAAPGATQPQDVTWRALVPGFLVSELRRGFEIGFMIYLPFLVIDLVVASILMSLGMMMLPPNAISLPFKLIFFVMVDGWRLISGSLVQSFAAG